VIAREERAPRAGCPRPRRRVSRFGMGRRSSFRCRRPDRRAGEGGAPRGWEAVPRPGSDARQLDRRRQRAPDPRGARAPRRSRTTSASTRSGCRSSPAHGSRTTSSHPTTARRSRWSITSRGSCCTRDFRSQQMTSISETTDRRPRRDSCNLGPESPRRSTRSGMRSAQKRTRADETDLTLSGKRTFVAGSLAMGRGHSVCRSPHLPLGRWMPGMSMPFSASAAIRENGAEGGACLGGGPNVAVDLVRGRLQIVEAGLFGTNANSPAALVRASITGRFQPVMAATIGFSEVGGGGSVTAGDLLKSRNTGSRRLVAVARAPEFLQALADTAVGAWDASRGWPAFGFGIRCQSGAPLQSRAPRLRAYGPTLGVTGISSSGASSARTLEHRWSRRMLEGLAS
jgi:hypothetical protein